MIAFLIGLSSSILTIFLLILLKRIDKTTIYGLALAGIGFLYVGYTWSNITIALTSGIQMIFFVALAYLGLRKDLRFMTAGYFLHGLWDLLYGQLGNMSLLPPHYDLFCSTYDFVIGIYLWRFKYHMNQPGTQAAFR